jgi:light-regulated signal transduction histidine kinase (bacteriophytochrome)
MGSLIDDLLLLSKVSRAQLERRPVDLSRMAHAIVAEFESKNADRETVVTIEERLSCRADQALVEVLLTNLFSNAFKFTTNVTKAEIRFFRQQTDAGCEYVVSDNGAGFDMRYAHKLFKPFQRLHSERQFPGTGIGLATCGRVVNKHGGEVWAKGSVGEGAEVHFTLGESNGR